MGGAEIEPILHLGLLAGFDGSDGGLLEMRYRDRIRRLALVVNEAGLGTSHQQKENHLIATAGDGVKNGCLSHVPLPGAPLVEICFPLQQELGHCDRPTPRCEVQWRLSATALLASVRDNSSFLILGSC